MTDADTPGVSETVGVVLAEAAAEALAVSAGVDDAERPPFSSEAVGVSVGVARAEALTEETGVADDGTFTASIRTKE